MDVVGHTAEQAAAAWRGSARILESHPNTILFEARDAAEGKKFWADRKRLGAIARRTNAFKMNEDIVLPLDALAEFARWVDDVNVEEERFAQLRFVERAEEVLGAGPRKDDPEWTAAKAPAALERCALARAAIAQVDPATLRSLSGLANLQRDLGALVSGYTDWCRISTGSTRRSATGCIVLATHMHAGDGNVHINIPVLSNDWAMLRADRGGHRPRDGEGASRWAAWSPASTASASPSSSTWSPSGSPSSTPTGATSTRPG